MGFQIQLIIVLLVCKLHTLDGQSGGCPASVHKEYCNSNCPPHCALVDDKYSFCDNKTGECYVGCKPGWYGSSCQHPCSKNCFANICNQHNGHCTLTCKAKYTGDFCEVGTKENIECFIVDKGKDYYVWNDRDANSLMGGTEKSQRKSEYLFSLLLVIITPLFATECPHCLHNDCDSTRVCIKGCKTGFADKYCQYVCPETCQQSRCEVGATGAIVCCSGCIDGYHGPRCNIPCAEGYKQCYLSPSNGSSEYKTNRYGNQCQHSCEDTCKGFACDDQGACLSTCTDGRFGANCSLTCRSHQQSCQQDSGQCVACKHGYYGDVCEKPCPSCLPVWEDNVQRCKPGCTICTEENKENAGTPTFHLEQKKWRVIIVLMYICVVLLMLSLMCDCTLSRNCGTIIRRYVEECYVE